MKMYLWRGARIGKRDHSISEKITLGFGNTKQTTDEFWQKLASKKARSQSGKNKADDISEQQ